MPKPSCWERGALMGWARGPVRFGLGLSTACGELRSPPGPTQHGGGVGGADGGREEKRERSRKTRERGGIASERGTGSTSPAQSDRDPACKPSYSPPSQAGANRAEPIFLQVNEISCLYGKCSHFW